MSSRVQKGGQKFKPVVKPRGRPIETPAAAPRKPPSFRETTVESFRAQSAQPNRAESVYASLPPAPLVVESSTSVQHDTSILIQPSTRVIRPHKPVSSGSAGGHVRPSSISALLDTEEGHSGTMSDVTNVASPVQEANPSRAVPIVSPSRSAPLQSAAGSHAISRAQKVTPAPSHVLPDAQPTLHSLLRGVTAQANVSTNSNEMPQQLETNAEQDAMSGPSGISTEQQLGSSAFGGDLSSQEMPPSEKRRRLRTRSNASHMDSITDAAVTAGDNGGNGAENRMRRRRKSRRAADAATANSEVHDGSVRAPRRSSRTRHSETIQPEVQEASDAASDMESSESGAENRRKRRRRSSTASTSTTAWSRRRRNPVIFDTDAGPGEELDPTIVTMAAICDDTGQGRVSSKAAAIQRNHLAWKATNKQKRERMRSIMEEKKYGRNAEEDETQSLATRAPKEAVSDENESLITEPSGTTAVEDEAGSGFNYKETLSVNRYTARVRIGPNGETIIDEESLFVDRGDNVDEATNAYQHVEESDQTKFTNSASYSRKPRSSRWSAEETELFYDALSQFGENYELISYVLPGRDRKACKAKFKAEDRKNPSRITYCLNNRIPYDIQTLARLTGRDFSGPPPEIKVPKVPKLMEEPQGEQSEPEQRLVPDQTLHKARNKSRTPAIPDDVEVVGDIETFEAGASDA